MTSLHRLTVAALGCGCALSSVLAGDWPQWRGPNRDDISTETGLLKSWPAGGPALAWKARGMGIGFSSVSIADGWIRSNQNSWAHPVVANGRLYLRDQDVLLCYDLKPK